MSDATSSPCESNPMISLFAKRKEAFLESLRHILASVTSDLFVQQMFEDPASAMFIPDRVIEIVERYLSDDREVYIQELYRAVSAIEAYFGEENAKDLIDTGKKILDYVTTAQRPVDENYIENLKRSAKFMAGTSKSIDKKSLMVIKQFLVDLRHCVEIAKKTALRMMKLIKNAMTFGKTKCRSAMANVLAQIEEHKNTAQQLKKELEDVQNRFSKHDIPKIRQHFEEQINEHITNEDKLNKQLNKSKKAMLAMTREHQKVLNELSETQTKLAEVRATISDMDKVKEQNLAYEEQIRALNEDIRKGKARIDELVAASKAKAVEVDAGLQESLTNAKFEIKEKESQIAELQKVVEKERREKQEVINAKSLLEVDVQMAQVKLSMVPSLQKERDEAVEKCVGLEQSTTELQARLSETTAENETVQRELEELREELGASLKEAQRQVDVNRALNQKMTELNEAMEEKATLLMKAQKENEKLRKEKEEQAASMEDQKKDLEDVKAKTDELRTKLSSTAEECRGYTSELQAKKQMLALAKRDNQELTDRLRESEEQREALERKLSDAMQKLKSTKTSLEQSNDALLYAQDDLRKKETAIKDIQRSEQLLKQQKTDLEADLEKAEKVIAQQKGELRESESQLRRMQQEIVEKDSDNMKLQTKIQTITEKIQAKKEKKKQMQSIIDTLQKETKTQKAQIESDQQVNDNLAQRLASVQKELKIEKDRKEAAERAKTSSAEEIRGLNEQMTEDRRRYKDEIMKLQQNISGLQDAKSDVQRKLDKVSAENKAMARRQEDMKAEDEKKQSQIKSLQAQNTQQANEILNLSNNLRNVNEKVKMVTSSLPGNGSRIEDVPVVLASYAKQTKEQSGLLSKLTDLLQSDNLVTSVSTLLKENKEAKDREESMMKILPESSPATLVRDVEKMKDALDKNKQEKKELLAILGTEPSKLIDSVAELKKRDQNATKREAEIKKIMSDYSFDSVPKRISALQDEVAALKSQARAIGKTVGADDIVKTVSDMQNRLSCYDRLTEDLLAVLPGADPTGLVKEVKQLLAEKDRLEQEEKRILSFKDGNLHSAIDELISESQELRQVTRVLPKSDESPSAIVSRLLDEKDKLETAWKDVQRYTGEDVVPTVAELVRTNKALEKLVPGEGSLPDKVTSLTRQVEKLEKEQKKIIASLPGEPNTDDIVTSVQGFVEQLNDLKLEQGKITGILGEYNGDNYERVGGLLKEKDSITRQQQQISELIPQETSGQDIVEKVASWNKLFTDMKDEMSAIQTCFPDDVSLSAAVKNMSANYHELTEEREQLSKLLASDDITPAVSSLVDSKKVLDNVQGIIGSQDLIGKAQELVAESERLQRVCTALKCPESTAIEETARSIQEQLTNVAQTFGLEEGKDTSSKVAELKNGLEAATRMITQILSLLSNNSKVNIQIPMDPSQEKQLLSIIENFRQKAQKAFADVEEIIKRGRGVGYNGTVAMESVDSIVQAAVDEEKQQGLERMHQELTSLRTMHEKERSAMDKQKAKLKRKIDEQREIVAQVQEKSAQKEEEYLLEIEKEQRAARFAQNECDREKRIHEELMRVIGGEATDKDFLKCHLGMRELAAITTAEQRLLQQRRM